MHETAYKTDLLKSNFTPENKKFIQLKLQYNSKIIMKFLFNKSEIGSYV